nr:MAG TPA: hypothetical protein [Caudoviricetes sp.]
MSTSVIIHEVEYPAEISGVLQNPKWDRRDTKAITLEMTHDQAVSLFVDGLAWSIKQVNTYQVFDDKGQPTGETKAETQTFDNSDYSVAGSITDNRDGTVTVMMGKHTELEIAQDARDEAESALAELEAAYDNG